MRGSAGFSRTATLMGNGRTTVKWPAPVDRKPLPLNAAFEHLVHGVEEVVAVRLDLEADQVGAQQAVQQFALPGADSERLGIGPGNVPEDRHARVGTQLLHQPRQQREVVVLHQLRVDLPVDPRRSRLARVLDVPDPEPDEPLAELQEPAVLGRVRGGHVLHRLAAVLVRRSDARPRDAARPRQEQGAPAPTALRARLARLEPSLAATTSAPT